MRTTKLLATLLVAALAIVACKQDEDYVLPSITLSTPTLDFSAATEQSIDLLATRDWQILGKPEWVQRIEPDHGPGTSTLQRIRLIADPNEGYNREDEIVFTIGLSKATLAISQPGAKGEIPVGTGTKDDPYTVKGVLRYIETLGADVESPQDVYIKGKISEITEPFSTQYGNASFKIKGDDGEVFTVYRALYLGNKKWTANDTQIQLNDEVVVCGKVINYKGNTPETQQNKAYVYSLNGETQGSGGGNGDNPGTASGTGTLADPYNAAGANAFIQTLADNAKSDKDIYVKGKICKIANNGTFGSYGNATFYISDDGQTGGADFYCYRVLYLGNRDWKEGDTQIKVGDDVIICGKVTKYVGTNGNATLETVQKEAYIYSLNGVTDGGSGSGGNEQGGNEQGGNEQGSGDSASGSGTLASPYNPAGAKAVAAALESGAKTESKVYVQGKISKIKYTFSAQYGTVTFDISADGTTNGTQFTCYSILYFKDASWKDGDKQIEVGNEVVVYGLLTNYNGTPETASKEACLYSLNGNTE